MTDKRYSVFISSTFEDLRNERQAVQDVIISSGDFPVQMESFPAVDEDQFAFIKALIAKCDYYVLIIGGRYGTPTEDGLSYTEKEYRYAAELRLPILVLLHGDRGNISANKSENTPDGKRRLDAFLKLAEKNRLRKTWTTLDGLKLAVREALDYAKTTKPGVGWVRGDVAARVEVLEELNEVRKENAKYRGALGAPEIELTLPPLPMADGTIDIALLPHAAAYRSPTGTTAIVRASWIALFPVFFNNLICHTSTWGGEDRYQIDEDESCIAIGSAIASEVEAIDGERCFKVSKATLKRLSSYYIEAGLMSATPAAQPFPDEAQKIARRHNIGDRGVQRFRVIEGKVAIIYRAKDQAGGDDEIPF